MRCHYDPSRIAEADWCEACGQPYDKPEEVVEGLGLRCGRVMVSHGDKSKRLSPAQAMMLRLLLKRGRVSREVLLMQLASEAESKLLDVYACLIRKALREVGSSVRLKPVWGWGFELRG